MVSVHSQLVQSRTVVVEGCGRRKLVYYIILETESKVGDKWVRDHMQSPRSCPMMHPETCKRVLIS